TRSTGTSAGSRSSSSTSAPAPSTCAASARCSRPRRRRNRRRRGRITIPVALLEVRDVNVWFGGNHAVRDVDLDVAAGRVTGLIGPNGAGKTTTFNVICGLQETRSGRVVLDGTDLSGLPPHKRARHGIARTFQRLEVFGSLTAYENVLASAEIHRG